MTTAREQGWAVCRACGRITQQPDSRCAICGSRVPMRMPKSLQRVWAFWLAGVIAYVPGNLYPIMISESFSGSSPATIIGGVVLLIHHHSYPVAAVVFVASLMVPITKFITIAWLATVLHRRTVGDDHRRHRAHEAIELIGRWSMIDVFVVAALAALIQLGGIMTIKPGIGIVAFATSVVFTMLSAMAFDPRLIWDQSPVPNPTTGKNTHD